MAYAERVPLLLRTFGLRIVTPRRAAEVVGEVSAATARERRLPQSTTQRALRAVAQPLRPRMA
ncbi:MAG: hypothetical protein M5U08_00520 [Burkholderiales bacterium]|nr:hypothetical protein [Burkholderiales bacterium]